MYTHSKKWVSNEQKLRNKIKAGNKTRQRMFPKSCAWEPDYDLDLHHEVMAKLRRDRDYERIMHEAAEQAVLRQQGLGSARPLESPMQAKHIKQGCDFSTNHSAVLAQPTVFVPSFHKADRPIAPWPCREELFHEGDYRISNEKHLRRMLPAPRTSSNATVPWSKRMYLQPLPMDDFRIYRNGMEETAEVDDEEAKRMLGSDLLLRLDPINKI